MKEWIRTRTLEEARYIIEHRATVRDAAAAFDISKSTVHKDVSERLRDIDLMLFAEVKDILDINLAERHLRGGVATKEKYARETP